MDRLALISKTQSLIALGDISGAESALVELADTEGDGALMAVLQQLTSPEILAMIRQHDTSKESVISLLVTPDMFAKAVVLEKKYKDLEHHLLRGMINSILFRDGANPVEFLNAIGDLEGGSEVLANYFLEYWSGVESFARTGTFEAIYDEGKPLSDKELVTSTHYLPPCVDQEEIADHDWMELAWVLRYQCPDLFVETLMILRARARAYSESHKGSVMHVQNNGLDDANVEVSNTDHGQTTPVVRFDDDESAI